MSHLNINDASMKKVGIGVVRTSNEHLSENRQGGGHIFESCHRVEGMAVASSLAGLIYLVLCTLCRIHTFTCYVLVSRAPFCVLMDQFFLLPSSFLSSTFNSLQQPSTAFINLQQPSTAFINLQQPSTAFFIGFQWQWPVNNLRASTSRYMY